MDYFDSKPRERLRCVPAIMDMKKLLTVFIALVIVAVAVVVGFSYLTTPQAVPQVPSNNQLLQENTTRYIPPGFKEYLNENYSFSLLYPESYTVTERNEGGGAMTVRFENTEDMTGFQIFVVVHEEDEVTEERFLADVPSGVRNNPMPVTLGGAAGEAFESEHEELGETYEVWVLRHPFLFEVTTLKGQEAFLQSILQTWNFI